MKINIQIIFLNNENNTNSLFSLINGEFNLSDHLKDFFNINNLLFKFTHIPPVKATRIDIETESTQIHSIINFFYSFEKIHNIIFNSDNFNKIIFDKEKNFLHDYFLVKSKKFPSFNINYTDSKYFIDLSEINSFKNKIILQGEEKEILNLFNIFCNDKFINYDTINDWHTNISIDSVCDPYITVSVLCYLHSFHHDFYNDISSVMMKKNLNKHTLFSKIKNKHIKF